MITMIFKTASQNGETFSFKQFATEAEAEGFKQKKESARRIDAPLDLKEFSGPELVSIHNLVNAGHPVRKFENRDKAVDRVFKALSEYFAADETQSAPEATEKNQETEVATKKTTKKAAKKAAKTTNGASHTRTDKSKKIEKLVSENPRREGSEGFKSFALIRSGMTVEKFVEAGGRMKDLQWDIKAGNLKLVTAD